MRKQPTMTIRAIGITAAGLFTFFYFLLIGIVVFRVFPADHGLRHILTGRHIGVFCLLLLLFLLGYAAYAIGWFQRYSPGQLQPRRRHLRFITASASLVLIMTGYRLLLAEIYPAAVFGPDCPLILRLALITVLLGLAVWPAVTLAQLFLLLVFLSFRRLHLTVENKGPDNETLRSDFVERAVVNYNHAYRLKRSLGLISIRIDITADPAEFRQSAERREVEKQALFLLQDHSRKNEPWLAWPSPMSPLLLSNILFVTEADELNQIADRFYHLLSAHDFQNHGTPRHRDIYLYAVYIDPARVNLVYSPQQHTFFRTRVHRSLEILATQRDHLRIEAAEHHD